MEIKQLHKQLLYGDIKWRLDKVINLDWTGEVLLMHLNKKGAQMATEMLRKLLKKIPAEPYKQMSFVQPASKEQVKEIVWTTLINFAFFSNRDLPEVWDVWIISTIPTSTWPQGVEREGKNLHMIHQCLLRKQQYRVKKPALHNSFPAHFCGAGVFLSAAPCIHSQRSLKLSKHKTSGLKTRWRLPDLTRMQLAAEEGDAA